MEWGKGGGGVRNVLTIQSVFRFSLKFVSKIFHCEKSAQYYHKRNRSSWQVPAILVKL